MHPKLGGAENLKLLLEKTYIDLLHRYISEVVAKVLISVTDYFLALFAIEAINFSNTKGRH